MDRAFLTAAVCFVFLARLCEPRQRRRGIIDNNSCCCRVLQLAAVCQKGLDPIAIAGWHCYPPPPSSSPPPYSSPFPCWRSAGEDKGRGSFHWRTAGALQTQQPEPSINPGPIPYVETAIESSPFPTNTLSIPRRPPCRSDSSQLGLPPPPPGSLARASPADIPLTDGCCSIAAINHCRAKVWPSFQAPDLARVSSVESRKQPWSVGI